MSYWDWALMGLLSMAFGLVGCASKLDFDHVSSGRHGMDAGALAADASSLEPTPTREPIDSSVPAAPADAGQLPTTRPEAHPADAGWPRTAAASDASLPDAGFAADPSAFSCAKLTSKPYFCDDFESLALSSHWSDVVVQPIGPLSGGTLDIDGDAARAGHYSLLAEVNDGLSVCDNCIELRAGLTLPTLQGPTKLRVELDARVEQIDPNDGRRVILFQIWWGTPEIGFTQHTLQLGSSAGNAWTGLVELATEAQLTRSTDPPDQHSSDHEWQQTPMLSQWVHIVYTLDVQDAIGTANVASLTVGDVVLFDGPLSFPLRNAKASLEVGVPWLDMDSFAAQDTSKRWRIRYDNVLVRYEPR